MTIHIIRAGQVKEAKTIAVLYQGAFREVLLVQTVGPPAPGTTTRVLRTVYNHYQEPPTALRGVTATHTTCTVAWTAPLLATDYQVTRRARVPGTTAFVDTQVLDWTPQTSQTVSGLVENMEYTFTVQARRFGSDGSQYKSTLSNPITLHTGYAAVLIKNPGLDTTIAGADLVYINAARTDTWTSSYNWGAGSKGPDVVQGYVSSAYRARNGYGTIAYTTARTQLDTEVKRIAPTSPSPVDLNKVTVVEARIDSIYRRSGGSGTPAIRVYPWKALYSPTTTRPVPAGGTTTGTTFTAPAEGKTRDELDFALLLTWAKEWVKAAPAHTGMLIYNAAAATGNATAGFNGYAILRAARASLATNPVADWRLKLWVTWNYTLPAKDPAWIPTRP